MVIMPMGCDHELDLRSHVDLHGPEVVQSDRLTGFSINAGVDHDPIAVTDMSDNTLPNSRAEH
jgi:hypothetical protein